MNPSQSNIPFLQNSSNAMEAVIAKIQRIGTRKLNVEEISSLRTLARFTDEIAYDYGYGIDAVRIYFNGGRVVCVTPEGRLYS